MTAFLRIEGCSQSVSVKEGPLPKKSRLSQGSDTNIEDFLEFFPESEKIIQFVHQFLTKLHQDKNLPEATLFFKQITADNEIRLKGLSWQEKAQTLFNLYKIMIIRVLEKESIFSESISGLQLKWPSETNLLGYINNIVNKKINCLHSGFPLFAISGALEISVTTIDLPGGDFGPMDQKSFESLSVSQQALDLFKILLGS